MVNREQLREICDKYGLDSKKIIKNNENVIEKADYTVYYSLVKPITYLIFYYIGAGVFLVITLIALIYFLCTRKK